MGFIQSFFIGFIAFSVIISGVILFQQDMFTNANIAGMDVSFNRTDDLASYSKMDDLYNTGNKLRTETFLENETDSSSFNFADLGTIGALRSVYNLIIEGPGKVLGVLESVSDDLNIPPIFKYGAITMIIFLFFFAIAGVLIRRNF